MGLHNLNHYEHTHLHFKIVDVKTLISFWWKNVFKRRRHLSSVERQKLVNIQTVDRHCGHSLRRQLSYRQLSSLPHSPLLALLFFIKPSTPFSLHRPSQGRSHCVLLDWLDFSHFFLCIPRSGGMLVLKVTRQVYVVKKNIYKKTFSRCHSGKNLQKAPKIVF